MARPLRIEFAGAVYHVMARGNHGRAICADDKDRQMWVATLAQAWQRTGWKIHAWVLMGNHYHLLLETPEPNLVQGMKWLQGTYTQRFNARHRKRGHLFQGRYRAVPVEVQSREYFQTVSMRTGRKELEAGWQALRRGWYLVPNPLPSSKDLAGVPLAELPAAKRFT